MTCGSGGIGNASIDTLLKDLRVSLGESAEKPLDRVKYSMEQVASRVHQFFEERAMVVDFKAFLLLRVCGYSHGRALEFDHPAWPPSIV
jgi:hypothetical protein